MNTLKAGLRYRLRLGLSIIVLSMTLIGCKTFNFDSLIGKGDDQAGKTTKNDKSDKTDKESSGPPNQHSLRVSQFLIQSDFPMTKDLPLFENLSGLREQVYKELQLPGNNTIVNVYVFQDQKRYERFMSAEYKDLPKRRAFFVARPRGVGGPEDLLVYTYWTNRITEDLRHELTHALLHSVLKDVPIWLDEGLAEYFELPTDQRGINQVHLDHLRQSAFKPNLKRLESLTQVHEMTPLEYRESWAWVHLMLRTKPQAKSALLGYLQQLKSHPNAGSLSDRLAVVYPALDDALQAHLAQIEVAEAERQQPPVRTVRGQNR
jgi:hypothetical protein